MDAESDRASVIEISNSDDESEVEDEDDHFSVRGMGFKIKEEPSDGPQDLGVPPMTQ